MAPRRRKWPLSVKMAAVMVLLALVPVLAVVLLDARQVEERAAQRERDALRRQATDAALRIGERVERLRAYAEVLAATPSLEDAVVRAGSADDAESARTWEFEHRDVWPLLSSLRSANAWFEHVYLLNENGVCVATSERATRPEMFGRDYSFRPYFRVPSDTGEAFVSDVLKNATSKGTAIFVSAPVLVDGKTRAVAVIKVSSEALHDVVGELSQLGRRAMFIDRFGVVVSDASDGIVSRPEDSESVHFHPLAGADASTLRQFRETKRYGDPEGEHYLDRIEQPLGLDSLWHSLGIASGSAEEALPARAGGPGVRTVIGFAPVWSGEDEPYGFLLVGEPSAQFREPLEALGRDALYKYLAVLGGIVLLMALAIRRLAGDVEQDAVAAQAETKRALDAVAMERETKRALLERLSELDPEHYADTLQAIAGVVGIDQEVALDVDRFDVRGLLLELADGAKSAASLGHTKIEVDADEDVQFETDRRRLALLLRELLDNAIANTRGGTINLTGELDPDDLVIRVDDTGMGLSPRQLRAFTGPITLPSADGPRLGLGIVVARQLAKTLGGSLDADTTGRGTTVTLRLPRPADTG